jgi:hypothetical protein
VLHQIVHNVFANGTGAACNQYLFHGAMVAAPCPFCDPSTRLLLP